MDSKCARFVLLVILVSSFIIFFLLQDGKHTYHLLIDYELDGDAFSLDLQLNKDLIPKGYFSKYQKDGIYVVNKPSLEVNI